MVMISLNLLRETQKQEVMLFALHFTLSLCIYICVCRCDGDAAVISIDADGKK